MDQPVCTDPVCVVFDPGLNCTDERWTFPACCFEFVIGCSPIKCIGADVQQALHALLLFWPGVLS